MAAANAVLGRLAIVTRKGLIISLLALSFSAGAGAQTDGSLAGIVSDDTGAAIPGAAVKLRNLETGAVRNVFTDGAGRYEVPLLAVGTYEVTAGMAGFKVRRRTVSLFLGERAEVDLTLSLAEVHQTVQVLEAPIRPEVTTRT